MTSPTGPIVRGARTAVTDYADFGDVGTADDVFSHIGHTSCPATYLVGIANSVTATDALGNVLRQRQSDVACTGNLTENRRFLSPGGTAAVTDMTYDGEGKLIRGKYRKRGFFFMPKDFTE